MAFPDGIDCPSCGVANNGEDNVEEMIDEEDGEQHVSYYCHECGHLWDDLS